MSVSVSAALNAAVIVIFLKIVRSVISTLRHDQAQARTALVAVAPVAGADLARARRRAVVGRARARASAHHVTVVVAVAGAVAVVMGREDVVRAQTLIAMLLRCALLQHPARDRTLPQQRVWVDRAFPPRSFRSQLSPLRRFRSWDEETNAKRTCDRSIKRT